MTTLENLETKGKWVFWGGLLFWGEWEIGLHLVVNTVWGARDQAQVGFKRPGILEWACSGLMPHTNHGGFSSPTQDSSHTQNLVSSGCRQHGSWHAQSEHITSLVRFRLFRWSERRRWGQISVQPFAWCIACWPARVAAPTSEVGARNPGCHKCCTRASWKSCCYVTPVWAFEALMGLAPHIPGAV